MFGVLPRATGLFGALALAVTFSLAPSAPSAAAQGPGNLPPVCFPTHKLILPCAGTVTTAPLDGSAVYDPEGDPLTFLWSHGCPNSVIENPTAQSTKIHIDTSGGCQTSCSVRLRVSDGQHVVHCRFSIEITGEIVASLDVKPTSCPNPIQVKSNGVVPVALCGSLPFDVHTVNVATLQLGRADGKGSTVHPASIKYSDVATPFEGDLCDCHTLGGDGITDLLLHFSKRSLVAALEFPGEPNKGFVEVTLTGETMAGTPFRANDCIRVQNK